jgi:hypothetical protein
MINSCENAVRDRDGHTNQRSVGFCRRLKTRTNTKDLEKCRSRGENSDGGSRTNDGRADRRDQTKVHVIW